MDKKKDYRKLAEKYIEPYIKNLKDNELYNDSYEMTIKILTDSLRVYLEAVDICDSEGIIVKGIHTPKINSAYTIMKSSRQDIIGLLEKMAGTISSKRKIHNSKMSETIENPLIAFLNSNDDE